MGADEKLPVVQDLEVFPDSDGGYSEFLAQLCDVDGAVFPKALEDGRTASLGGVKYFHSNESSSLIFQRKDNHFRRNETKRNIIFTQKCTFFMKFSFVLPYLRCKTKTK